jgi:Mrp family chromosome partitioning ATPase
MTALDQAFIKAYSHQGATPTAPVTRTARPTVPLSQALAQAAEAQTTEAPAKVTLESLLAGLETPDCGGEVQTAGAPSAADCAASVPPGDPTAQPAGPQAHAGPATPSWHPLLQVDHFLWPDACQRLHSQAAGAMDQLADAFSAMVRQGRKVLGLGSCGEGEGVTTLVLAAGRRLVERGLRVVVVDANLADPQLAQRLGLLPQVGWEDALAGRLPLEEVAVESLGDRLAVLPVREPFAGTGSESDEPQMIASLETLAAHYDVVLVDLGGLEDRATVSGALARGIGARLHAVVLVHNVRQTTPDRLADVQRCLTAASIPQAGVVENFVAA